MTIAIIVFAGLAGGAVGSFAGVVATRGLRASLGGRSHCDACQRPLAWYELVPFLSFIALRGRCRTCGGRIGWPPFVWEVTGGAVGIAIALAIALTAGHTEP
ncbi:MAG TPA: prepilin peptidase [Candidatus Dormibacteraeota bacterium]